MPKTAVVVVTNEIGLHARPAAKLVQALARFKCDVFLERNGEKVNAKSIIGVLTLAAGQGSQMTVHTQGPDEDACLAFVREFFESGFGEAYGEG